MTARPPALLDLGRYPGGGTRRHPASMSLRGGRRGPADHLRRDRREQGHPGRLPPLAEGKERQSAFANDPRGHAALLAWADRYADGLALHFCLEATGPYSEAPADAL